MDERKFKKRQIIPGLGEDVEQLELMYADAVQVVSCYGMFSGMEKDKMTLTYQNLDTCLPMRQQFLGVFPENMSPTTVQCRSVPRSL